jgi:hypothetical protein
MAKPVQIEKASRGAGLWADQAGKRVQAVLLRSIEKIRAEWALICTAHNLTKLVRAA